MHCNDDNMYEPTMPNAVSNPYTNDKRFQLAGCSGSRLDEFEMHDCSNNFYEDVESVPTTTCNDKDLVSNEHKKYSNGSMKITVLFVLMGLLVAALTVLIVLHFHHQSEWKKVQDAQDQDRFNLSIALMEARDQIRRIEERSDDLTDKNSRLSEAIGEAESKIAMLQTNNQDLAHRVNENSKLSEVIDEAESKIAALQNKGQDSCPISYEGKCFWFEMKPWVTCQGKDEFCALRGGKPANIYSSYHYYMILGYLRMFTGSSISAWLGLTYKENTAYLSDGTTAAPYVKWYRYSNTSGYPIENVDSYSCIMLEANSNSSSMYQHMMNSPSYFSRSGVICER